MTDNEIIKALECCTGYDCENCKALKYCDYMHPGALARASLDLINRQKAIIEKSEKVEHFADKTIETANAEIERLKDELHHAKVEISKFYEQADAYCNEAIDVFADSLKIKLNRMIDNLVKEMTEVETNQRKEDAGK